MKLDAYSKSLREDISYTLTHMYALPKTKRKLDIAYLADSPLTIYTSNAFSAQG